VFATLTSAQEAIAELSGGNSGPLLIGASTTPGIYVLPALMVAFERDHRRMSVAVRIANSRVIEDHVRANELDLGLVGGHGLRPGEECLAAGVVDELVLIAPPGHAWARHAPLDASTILARERLLLREDGSATRAATERALQKAEVKIGRTLVLDHTEAIKQAVMVGLGVAFVSIYAVPGELETGRLARVRLRSLDIRRHFDVIHNEARPLTAGARAFVATVEAYGRPMRGPDRPRRRGR
jgi:DNA-binding transcriptional LysR family regulator